MTKVRLIKLLSAKSGVDVRETEAVLASLAGLVREAVAAGGEFRIPAIGVIYAALRDERTVLNPMTREPMQIPAGYHVRFRAASVLKAASNRDA